MDILFVNQPRLNGIPVPREIDCSNPQQDFLVQPLGLAYLAAAAKKYCSVGLIDANILDKDYNFIEEAISKDKPKIIIGGFTAPSMEIDLKLGEIAKKYNSLFGVWGPLPAAMRDFIFKNYEIDFIIENEPEMTMYEIARKVKNKKNPFKGVKGLSYKDSKRKVIWNGYRKLEPNLNSLPIPSYELLEMDKYYTPYNRRLPMTIMRTSRGCIAKCIFCITGGQTDMYRGYGAPWRAYSAERTLREIELLVKKFGIKEINFFDAEFTINKTRVIEICKGILKRKLDITWNCNARADQVSEEALKWMKKAGCYGISYGLESANKEVLACAKKNITPEQVEKAVIITKKAGIQPALYFMIGLPHETEETIKETIKFAKKMALKYNLRPQCTIATPYPGTTFYEMAKKNNWIKEDYEELEQTTPSIAYPGLSQEQLKYWHKKFYREVVLNPIRLIKRVLRIRHWNEIKSIPMHLKDFVLSYLNKLKYIR